MATEHDEQALLEELEAAMEAGNTDKIIEISALIDGADGETGGNDTATPAVPEVSEDKQLESESAQQNASLSVDDSQVDVSHIPLPNVQDMPALVDEPDAQLSVKEQQQVEELQARLALYERQLQENGLNPEKLPHEVSVSQEELDELKADLDELGPLGSVTYKLTQMFGTLQQQLNQQNQTPLRKEVEVDPFVAVDGLKAVMENPVTRALAVKIDDALKVDPKWQSVPEIVRFKSVVAEVQRQQQAQQPAQRTQAKSADFAPYSIASAQAHSDPQSSQLNQLESMNESELSSVTSNMSVEQLESLLDQL